MMKKQNINGYLIADATFLILIILFVTLKFQIKYLAGGFVLISLIVFFQAAFGKTQIINKTTKTLKAKFEDNQEDENALLTVKPNEIVSGLDGIKLNGVVYKIPDGVHATVKENNVRINSIIGLLCYKVVGGVLTTPTVKQTKTKKNKETKKQVIKPKRRKIKYIKMVELVEDPFNLN